MLQRQSTIYTCGGVVLLIAAYFSVGHFNYDEHFEVLELAGFKLHHSSEDNLTWEYKARMTSTLQATIAVVVHKALSSIGDTNPFAVTFVLRLFAALIGFLGAWMSFRAFRNQIVDARLRSWFLFLSFFFWITTFHRVHFSSEGLSGSFFLMGLAWYFLKKERTPQLLVVTGALLGIAFVFRYPVGLMILGFLLWLLFIEKESARHLFYVCMGIVLAIGCGLAVDAWFYGEWTLTPWNYLMQNLVEGKAEIYGAEPWWYYLWNVFLNAIPPFSLAYLAAFVALFIKRLRDPVIWISIPFIIILIFIDYKSLSMLIPLAGLMPLMLVKAYELCFRNRESLMIRRMGVWFAMGFLITNSIALIPVMFLPAATQVGMFREIYFQYSRPTLLYYSSEHNPFSFGLNAYYYKRPDLDVRYISDIRLIVPDARTTLVALSRDEHEESLPKGSRLVCTSWPPWMLRFNFNNWVERSKHWRIYELRK